MSGIYTLQEITAVGQLISGIYKLQQEITGVGKMISGINKSQQVQHKCSNSNC